MVEALTADGPALLRQARHGEADDRRRQPGRDLLSQLAALKTAITSARLRWIRGWSV
ncbi:MAG TPA: hypothetical protein VE645_12075 [Pseudonocardiaceae bacterium]|jgi:hypothetical protein|nr:hypothetical protein [Pseudonocardiaceae bacterium]